MKKSLSLAIMVVISACSSMPRKIVLDTSGSKPDWVESSKTAFQKGDKVYFRSSATVRGSDRVDGCYDHARLDGRGILLSEIATDVKGSLNEASQSISENAENYLTKVQSGDYEGRVVGMRYSEEYFERFAIQDNERISCYVLGEVRESDYNTMKRSIVDKLVEIDSRIKDAITEKNINFFKKPGETDNRQVASAPVKN